MLSLVLFLGAMVMGVKVGWGMVCWGVMFLWMVGGLCKGQYLGSGGMVDSVSCCLLLMTVVLFFLVLQGSAGSGGGVLFGGMSMILGSLVVCSFLSVDFYMFYVFFEGSMIPMVLIVMWWGYQSERFGAGVYMLIYTVFGSLMFLVGVINYVSESLVVSLVEEGMGVEGMMLVGVFFVKLPVYGVHLWLPKAHVESISYGSMILAGVMLKLGGYGLLRLFMKYSYGAVGFYLMGVSMVGGVISGLVCFRQVDYKVIMAYSSICHMSVIVGGSLVGEMGVMGCVLMMVGHGYVSSGLFFLSGLMFEWLGSRSMYLSGGMGMSGLGGVTMILCLMNMSCPLSLGLLGEIMMYMGMVNVGVYVVLYLGVVTLLSGGYSVYVMNMLCHGSMVVEGSCGVVMKDLYVIVMCVVASVVSMMMLVCW